MHKRLMDISSGVETWQSSKGNFCRTHYLPKATQPAPVNRSLRIRYQKIRVKSLLQLNQFMVCLSLHVPKGYPFHGSTTWTCMQGCCRILSTITHQRRPHHVCYQLPPPAIFNAPSTACMRALLSLVVFQLTDDKKKTNNYCLKCCYCASYYPNDLIVTFRSKRLRLAKPFNLSWNTH